MFGRKKGLKEGDHVFSSKQDGNYRNFIFGTVTGVNESKIGINGLTINPFTPTLDSCTPVTVPKIKFL